MAFDPDAYLAQKSAGASGSFDPDAYLKSKGQEIPTSSEPSTLMKISDTVSKAFPHTMLGAATNPAVQDLALRGLDYAGGLARTGMASATGNASMDDLYSALKGRATRSAEFLKRAGVPEGPSVPMTNFSARDAAGFAGDIATDPLTYVQPLNRVMGAGQAVEAMGNAAYKSGLKNIDMEVTKYGKEPVSDLLMKNRVTGSARSIADQMQVMADQRLANRNAILQRATDRGAETNVSASLSGAQSFIDALKARNDQRLNPLIGKMESEVATLNKSAARPSMPAIYDESQTLKELPVARSQTNLEQGLRKTLALQPENELTWYNAPTLSGLGADGKPQLYQRGAPEILPGRSGVRPRGVGIMNEPIINNPVDSIPTSSLPVGGEYQRPANYELVMDGQREIQKLDSPYVSGFDLGPKVLQEPQAAVKGPTPIQMSQMKTNTYNAIGDQAYQEAKRTPLYKDFAKTLAAGQKQEVENSVAKTLGDDAAQQLRQHNDELGRLLTSQDRAERDALIEGRKNNHTPVDGMLIGHAVESANPFAIWPYLSKKLSDVSKATGPRTTTGLMMQDLGQTGIPDALTKRVLIDQNDQNTPWVNLSRRTP